MAIKNFCVHPDDNGQLPDGEVIYQLRNTIYGDGQWWEAVNKEVYDRIQAGQDGYEKRIVMVVDQLPAQPVEEGPDHGETVLRIQGALGITTTGWISPDVILMRIEKLVKQSQGNT